MGVIFFDYLSVHAPAFFLVLSRIVGLFIAAPMLSSTAIPMRARAMLALTVTLAAYPTLSGPGGAGVLPDAGRDVFSLLGLMCGESIIGFAIGLIAATPLLALEMSGVLAGQQMGFGLAKVYNPEANFDADLLGQLLFYLGLGAFLAINGVETMFGLVLESFRKLPIGAVRTVDAPLDLLVGAVSSGFELAIRVAAPVTATILLLVIVFGVIGKTMPQINIMSIGFTAKILAGLTVLMLSAAAGAAAVSEHVARTMVSLMRWVGA